MIENPQKTLSGPQGVLLGVPRDVQIPKMVLQDARMCPQKPKQNLKLAPNQASRPANQQISRGGRRQGRSL